MQYGRFNELRKEIVLYGVVSALDLFMTCFLLSYGNFYETNPLADWMFQTSGVLGLVLYKFSIISIAIAVLLTLASENIKVAKKIISFAIVITALVVVYSAYLFFFQG